MRRLALPLAVLLSSLAAGCAPTPPARWAEGGALLAIGRARWERPAEATVDLLPDGRVLVDGDHVWTIDASGRVFSPAADPIAVLSEDGSLVGPDEVRLGAVGVDSATSPIEPGASVRIGTDGVVQHVRPSDPRPLAEGAWHGCDAPVTRACMLVTEMLTVQEQRSRPTGGVGVGFGIGFGAGRR